MQSFELLPPELGKAETISAIASATNMVMNTTATQPHTTLTGPARNGVGSSVKVFQQTARLLICVMLSSIGLKEPPSLKANTPQ